MAPATWDGRERRSAAIDPQAFGEAVADIRNLSLLVTDLRDAQRAKAEADGARWEKLDAHLMTFEKRFSEGDGAKKMMVAIATVVSVLISVLAFAIEWMFRGLKA